LIKQKFAETKGNLYFERWAQTGLMVIKAWPSTGGRGPFCLKNGSIQHEKAQPG